MTRHEALTALMAKVEAGVFPGNKTGPQMGFPDTSAVVLYDAFSGSLDAAVSLVKATLPGWHINQIGEAKGRIGPWCCVILPPTGRGTQNGILTSNDDPARALFIATIKALIAEATP